MNRTPDLTFVTYRDLPNLDPDDRLAADLLSSRGISVGVAIWNDPAVDWSRAGICIVRSTWDYHLDHSAFMRWAEHVAASAKGLWNPLAVIRWNSHKSYLDLLAARGAPVVPTRWLKRGQRADLAHLLRDSGWTRAVVKPAVGLATRGVMAIDLSKGLAGAQAHVDALLAEHDVMVQPFIASVETSGEKALVFIDGRYSHAASKIAFQPLAPTGDAGEKPAVATREEIAVATSALEMTGFETLYARIDLVAGDDGMPKVLELELVEPSLFLGMDPAGPRRFAAALEKLL